METKQEIYSVIKGWIERDFQQEDLKQTALTFLNQQFQEKVRFGKMTMLHFYMFGGKKWGILEAAAAIELMICALNIFDHVQDNHHVKKAQNVVDSTLAINIASSFTIMAQSGLKEAAAKLEAGNMASYWFDRYLMRTVTGRISEVMNQIQDEDTYMQMIEAKMASRFECACTVGVVLAVGEPNDIVSEYARQLGLAVQIKHDLHGLRDWGPQNDFLNRKRTLPILFMLNIIGQQNQWLVDYFNGEKEVKDILHRKREIQTMLDTSGALLYATARMQAHYTCFLELLNAVQGDPLWKETIRDLFPIANV